MPNDPVAEFEGAFAARLGVSYAVAVNSGTSALHAALMACDVRGGEVIMPALCPAMDAFAIIHAGAVPVFADVDPRTHLVTAETIAPHVTHNTAAVITVALHGLPVDMDPILELSEKHGFYVIDDCAQALLAAYKGVPAGTAADIGCFSFERKKHMTTGSEGGMVVTSSANLAMRARKFAGLGYKHMTADAGRTSLDAKEFQRPDYERFDTIGLNYRMSWVQANMGLSALANLDQAVNKRRLIATLLTTAIMRAPADLFALQEWSYPAGNSYYTVAAEYHGDDWIGFYNAFVLRGGDGFYAMPQVPYREPALKSLYGGYEPKPRPIAEQLQRRLMLFKTHYRDLNEAKRQVDILARLIDERA